MPVSSSPAQDTPFRNNTSRVWWSSAIFQVRCWCRIRTANGVPNCPLSYFTFLCAPMATQVPSLLCCIVCLRHTYTFFDYIQKKNTSNEQMSGPFYFVLVTVLHGKDRSNLNGSLKHNSQRRLKAKEKLKLAEQCEEYYNKGLQKRTALPMFPARESNT